MSTLPFSHAASAENTNKLEIIFKKPLIVGASVSGDYLTPSPGKTLALRYTKSSDIKVIAKKGTAGREILKSVSATDVKNASAVVAIDLFFWDSFMGSPAESTKALDRLVKLAEQRNIPLVLGEVPELMPSRQPHAALLNKKMRELCTHHSQCKILPLDAILRKTLLDGHIEQDGKKYALDSLLPDGLHISKPASEYLADQIKKLF